MINLHQIFNDELLKQDNPYNEYQLVDMSSSPLVPTMPNIFIKNTITEQILQVDLTLEDIAIVNPRNISSEVHTEDVMNKIKARIDFFNQE